MIVAIAGSCGSAQKTAADHIDMPTSRIQRKSKLDVGNQIITPSARSVNPTLTRRQRVVPGRSIKTSERLREVAVGEGETVVARHRHCRVVLDHVGTETSVHRGRLRAELDWIKEPYAAI